MRTLLVITGNFLKLTFNKKIKYLFFFIVPVISFIAVTLLVGITDNSRVAVGYANNDTGHIGADLITYLEKTGKNKIIPLPEEELRTSIIDGDIVLALVIPGDFSSRITNRREPVIRLTSLQGEAVAGFIRHGINQFISNVLTLSQISGTDRKLGDLLYTEFLENTFTLETRDVKDAGVRKTAGSVSIGFFLFIILWQAAAITGLMLKEKQNRTFLRIRTAPVREIIYSLGNMLAAFIILASEIIITLLVIMCIPGIELSLPVIIALPLLLAYSIAAIGLGIMITALAQSTLQAGLLTSLIITISSMLGGSFWPLDFMTEFIQKSAVIYPQSWVMKAVAILQNGGGLADIGLTILVLLAFGALFISVYAYRMRHSDNLKSFV